MFRNNITFVLNICKVSLRMYVFIYLFLPYVWIRKYSLALLCLLGFCVDVSGLQLPPRRRERHFLFPAGRHHSSVTA